MRDIIIRAEDLSFSYMDDDSKEIQVLKHINLEIERGSFVAVLGHNGSGKSTLAKLFNLIYQPSDGRVFVNGVDTSVPDLPEKTVLDIRKSVAMVFQNPDNQIVSTIVEEDVAFGPENLGVPTDEIRERVDMALRSVGMQDYSKHSPHQLSGGQKQRVAIAGAIAMLPQCIVFDESTAMLDPNGRREVLEVIEKLNREEHITIILITHFMDEAARADRILVLDHGELKLDGTPREVFSHVDQLYEMGLDVPQSTRLLDSLKKEGAPVTRTVIFAEEAVDEIEKMIESKRKNQ